MTTRPLLSIIPVAFNSESEIAKTIEHLESITSHLSIEIVVVDNASADSTAEEARRAVRRGRVVTSDVNLGFGGGANLGLKHARGDYVLIMNDDVMPRPGAIEKMIDTLRSDPRIGLVGPRMLHPDGSVAPATRSHLPGIADEAARWKDKVTRRDDRNAYPSGEEPREVALLICACVIAHTETLRDLGGFSPLFFFYGEDIDLCRRLQANGLKAVTVPSAEAVHDQDVAPSRRKSGRDFMDRILNARDTYYRVWLSKPERVLINLVRAFGGQDQPHRFKFHLRKAMADGGSLAQFRRPILDDPQP